MNKNKHLLLWSSLGALALLVGAAVEENVLKEWRQIQRQTTSDAGPIDVRLRQIVVPGLHATDRCVSCHVGMAPGEQGLSGHPAVGPHPPMVHDPGDFGCTVCHGGQGRATEKADAHGRVPHWPEPMIPIEFAQAGCGSCHTHLQVPDLATLHDGRNLVERHDCLACHAIDGRGGTIRPGEAGGIEGPNLSQIGAAGYAANWYEQHLRRATEAQDGPWKASFGPIQEAERGAMEVFLASRVGAPRLVEAKSLFHSLGCRGCHKVGGVGGDDGPDLSVIGQRDPALLDFTHVEGEHTLTNWLVEHFHWPAKVVPGSQMPAMGLNEEQIELLTLYMLSLRRSSHPEAYWPRDRIRAERFSEREFSTDGATLYGTFCAACHGGAGEGRRYPDMPAFPAVGNPDFLAVASDEFIAETVRRGRPGRRMPAWGDKDGGLRPEEITAVVAHLRELGGVAAPVDERPARWVEGDAAVGERLFKTYCAGCHGPDGQGVDAPALNNKVLLSSASDTYLVETIARGRRGTVMLGFRTGSPTHPSLTEAEIEALVSFLRTWE